MFMVSWLVFFFEFFVLVFVFFVFVVRVDL